MNRALRKRAAKLRDKAKSSLSKMRGSDFQSVAGRVSTEQYIATLNPFADQSEDGPSGIVVTLTRELMDRTEEIENVHEGRFLGAESRAEIKCAAGCSWCCRRPLVVSILDAFAVSYHLLREGDTLALDSYLQSIAVYGNRRADLNRSYRPCPFLNEQDRCRVYPARPIVCRAFHSTNVEACRIQAETESADRDIPMFTNLFGFRGMALSGARQAVTDLGLDDRPVVLARAVKLILEDFDGVASQWLQGEEVFETAVVGP